MQEVYVYFNSEKELYYQFLSSLGCYYRLRLKVDLSLFSNEISHLCNSWKRYNPRKNIDRYGISLTSLDGQETGVPDLDSVSEYNIIHGTKLNDMSFRVTTESYKKLNSISSVVAPLEKYLGRSHIIKLNQGGFFPPHRDAYFSKDECFRIFAPLTGCSDSTFIFLLNGERIYFTPGSLYFINTRIEHSVFSYENDALMLILNLELCDETIKLITGHLDST